MSDDVLDSLKDDPRYVLLQDEIEAVQKRVSSDSSFGLALTEQLNAEHSTINLALDDRILFYRKVLGRMEGTDFERVVTADPCDDITTFEASLLKLSHVLDNRFAEIRALSEIATEINEGLFLDDVLNHVFETFQAILPYDRVGFALVEESPDGSMGKTVRSYWVRSRVPGLHLRKGYSLPLGKTTLGDVSERGRPRRINDLETYLVEDPNSDATRRLVDEGIRSNLTWPLQVGGETIGFIFFSSRECNAYDDRHLALYDEISERLAMTVGKSKFYQDLTIRNEFIRKLFGRYISNEIAQVLLDDPNALKMGGKKAKVTVLISDVRGFTTMSEKLSPENVVAVLNNQLDVMVDVIRKHGGTIDNIIGDAIMVLFGVPLTRENDAEKAVACGLAMQRAMEDVNRRNRAAGLPDIQIGIGINTGDVVAGNIGSETHAKYSVIGAAVNLAARVESLSKGGQVLISEKTFDEVRDDFQTGDGFQASVKGIEKPVTVYQVLETEGTP